MPTHFENAIETQGVTNDMLWQSVILDVRDIIRDIADIYQFELPITKTIHSMMHKIEHGVSAFLGDGFEVRRNSQNSGDGKYDNVPEVVLYHNKFACAPLDSSGTIVRIDNQEYIPFKVQLYKDIQSLLTKHRDTP